MKKINKKGFFLSETMVVIAVVAVVILSVFKLFNSVYYRFLETEDYNTANAINALSNIKKYYESLGPIDTDLITEDISYVDLTNNEKYESEYYTRLKSEFKIDSIYLIDLNKLTNMNVFHIRLRKYLDTLKNKEGIVLLVSIGGKEFAYTEIIHYSAVTLVGNEEDEFGVYIPINGIFVDPGYKNWDGDEPITTWENEKVLDTSKKGTYYLHYDFNGKIFRRKVVVGYSNAAIYIEQKFFKEDELHNGLVKTTATYTNANSEEITINSGIRYVGTADAVKNQVYFNCEETDGTNAYGTENYDYASSCEIWRIIGVFEVEDENGDTAQRVKLINTNSTFKASWDSSDSTINEGYGINQWGPSGDYKGADLMQLLNGYYIGAPNSECKYNNDSGQSGFAQTCTKEGLVAAKMKPLTNTALNMIDNSLWYTYATNNSTEPSTLYLQETGITKKYTGCKSTEAVLCELDGITRNNKWIGLVGLMTVSDIRYAGTWLFDNEIEPWTISPYAAGSYSSYVCRRYNSGAGRSYAKYSLGVWPNVYLSTNVDIVGGNGDTEPYRLKLV